MDHLVFKNSLKDWKTLGRNSKHDSTTNSLPLFPPFPSFLPSLKIRATCYTKFRYKDRKTRKKNTVLLHEPKIRANCNSPSKMVARSFQKTLLSSFETLFFFFFFFFFFPSLLIYMERGGGRVQLSWNVANFRANRRVFRMCSDSEKQVNLG